FFQSIRCSEDLDLDVVVLSPRTLKGRVDRLLGSPALTLPLKTRGIAVTNVSAPKQTETTQRWKLGLNVEGRSVPLRTKIEFSRRNAGDTERLVEPVDRQMALRYQIPPPVVQHYAAATAVRQKIEALLGRPATQARDVFDLQLLKSKL